MQITTFLPWTKISNNNSWSSEGILDFGGVVSLLITHLYWLCVGLYSLSLRPVGDLLAMIFNNWITSPFLYLKKHRLIGTCFYALFRLNTLPTCATFSSSMRHVPGIYPFKCPPPRIGRPQGTNTNPFSIQSVKNSTNAVHCLATSPQKSAAGTHLSIH